MFVKKYRSGNRGFTLIELMVVIAIIGLLASAVMAGFTEVQKKARDARRSTDIKAISDALVMYSLDNAGKFPTPTGSSNRFVNITNLSRDLSPKYIQKIPSDPYFGTGGNNYRYCQTDGARSFVLQRRDEQRKSGSDWCTVQTPNMPVNGCNIRNGNPPTNARFCK